MRWEEEQKEGGNEWAEMRYVIENRIEMEFMAMNKIRLVIERIYWTRFNDEDDRVKGHDMRL